MLKLTNALSFYWSQNVLSGSTFLSQPKNLTAFSASSKTFVPAQKQISLNANHLFVWHKMLVTATISKIFCSGTQNFGTCKRTRHEYILILELLFAFVMQK